MNRRRGSRSTISRTLRICAASASDVPPNLHTMGGAVSLTPTIYRCRPVDAKVQCTDARVHSSPGWSRNAQAFNVRAVAVDKQAAADLLYIQASKYH